MKYQPMGFPILENNSSYVAIVYIVLGISSCLGLVALVSILAHLWPKRKYLTIYGG